MCLTYPKRKGRNKFKGERRGEARGERGRARERGGEREDERTLNHPMLPPTSPSQSTAPWLSSDCGASVDANNLKVFGFPLSVEFWRGKTAAVTVVAASESRVAIFMFGSYVAVVYIIVVVVVVVVQVFW